MTVSGVKVALFVVWAKRRPAGDVTRTTHDAMQTHRASERFFTWKRETWIDFGFCIFKEKRIAEQDVFNTEQTQVELHQPPSIHIP